MFLLLSREHRDVEMRRRIADCRERLRRTRITQKIHGRAATVTARREVLELAGAFDGDVRGGGGVRATSVAFTEIQLTSYAEVEDEVALLSVGAEEEAEA